MANSVPHYVWATCDVEHESRFGFIPAWLEWYRVGFAQGAWVRRMRGGSRGVYAWSVQGQAGEDREKFLANSGFGTVPAALEFAEALGWMHNIRVLRQWTENKPGHLPLDEAQTA